VALLDPVVVEVYGSMMPLNQVATVSAPEPRMLSVQVWDKSNVIPVEKGIAHANLGLNPIIDGQTLRLPIPDLTQDRRKELAKLAGNMPKTPRSRSATCAAMRWKPEGPTRRRRKSPRTSASGRRRGPEADRQARRRYRRPPRQEGTGNPDAVIGRASENLCDDWGRSAPCRARHVAIIMDGNGRWAKKRHLPRAMGHQRRRGGRAPRW
jgi:hypothetical protein